MPIESSKSVGKTVYYKEMAMDGEGLATEAGCGE